MRLVCPNCEAEYEVDADMVPDEGRDVQCSNCTTTWFQPGAGAAEEPVVADVAPEDDAPVAEPEAPEPDAPEQEPAAIEDEAALAGAAAAIAGMIPRKPAVDQASLDVIHEEVARETAAREAERGGIETQPDLGLDDSETEDRARAARDRMARRRGLETEDDDGAQSVAEDDEALTAAPKRDEAAGKGELFPDIEEINSTLSPEAAEAEAEAERLAAEGGDVVEVQRSKFRLGFGLMLLVALALLLLYVYAPQLSQRVPALAGTLESYVSSIDGARVWLDTAAQGLVDKIGTGLASDAAE